MCDLLYLDNLFLSDESVISVPENATPKFSLHPNPAHDWLKIETPLKNGNVTLTDLSGKKLLEVKGENLVYVGNLPSGMYFLNYNHPQLEKSISKKVMIAQ